MLPLKQPPHGHLPLLAAPFCWLSPALSVVSSSLSLQPYQLTNKEQNQLDLDHFGHISFFSLSLAVARTMQKNHRARDDGQKDVVSVLHTCVFALSFIAV